MKLERLSATSVKTFEACPAQWRERYINFTPHIQGVTAGLGSAVHETLENWVAGGFHLSAHGNQELIEEMFRADYWNHMDSGSFLEDGIYMVRDWCSRTDLRDRTVLSTEVKKRFPLPTSIGPIQVTYIFDRFDQIGNAFEVVDYKTGRRNMPPGELKYDTQARVYALAAQLEYPDADEIWVTFDQLRYGEVGVRFSKEDNRETWHYLKRVAERIIESNGAEERLNNTCRFCVRAMKCSALTKHVEAGGPLGITDVGVAAKMRYEVDQAMAAMSVMRDDLDLVLLAAAEDAESDAFEVDDMTVSLFTKSRRTIDPEAIAIALGDDLAPFVERYGGLGVGAVDKALKDEKGFLDVVQLAELETLIGAARGQTKVYTRPTGKLE